MTPSFLERSLVAVALQVVLMVPAWSADPELPSERGVQRAGHLTCSGALCHGAVQAWMRTKGSSVRQNEYLIWQRRDRHATAYDTLRGAESKRIGANLGIAAPWKDDACLSCHSDLVPSAQRGPGFSLAGGVACEACHGGARHWLASHMNDDHATNVSNGLYPTEDPTARARLCTSCHVGDANHFVTHRIMGAGHPRISFELDTFSAIQPAHYVADADYEVRKTRATPATMWAVGQAVSLERTAQNLLERGQGDLFPELVFFDCHACHHPMSDTRWSDEVQAGPGVPRLDDVYVRMAEVIAGRIAPELAVRLAGERACLHRAVHTGWADVRDCATALQASGAELAALLVDHVFTGEEVSALVQGIASGAAAGAWRDYAGAEQATMAMAALLAHRSRKPFDDTALEAALDEAYAATADHEAFEDVRFREAAAAFGAAWSR